MAEQLGIHPETLRQAAVRRDVPAKKLGRQWLFRPEAVDAWLNENEEHELEAHDARRRQRLPPDRDRALGRPALDRRPAPAPISSAHGARGRLSEHPEGRR